jgi:hypothetical protein
MGTIRVDCREKAVERVHLSVHPPAGRGDAAWRPARGTVSTWPAPTAVSRLGWIRRPPVRAAGNRRETPAGRCVERESHSLPLRPIGYLLSFVWEVDDKPSVTIDTPAASALAVHTRAAMAREDGP